MVREVLNPHHCAAHIKVVAIKGKPLDKEQVVEGVRLGVDALEQCLDDERMNSRSRGVVFTPPSRGINDVRRPG